MNELDLKMMTQGPLTYMDVPYSEDLSQAKAAILGIPFDCGMHPFRIGSRQGPDAIREQSRLMRPYNSELADFNPMERLGLVDCGNLRLIPSRILDAFERIESATACIVAQGVVAITMGGDGSVSYPQMRAVGKRHHGLSVIHLDAHPDTTPPVPGNEHHTGTQFHHAATERIIDPETSYHIGIRGTTYIPGSFKQTRDLGYKIISMDDLLRRGLKETLHELHEKLDTRPVYLCIDMDVFDPSCAPGVCAPSWGGLTAREGIDFLRGLAGLNLVAVDVNTVSPPHDVNGMTGYLAAALIYETLVLLCRYRRIDQPHSG